jgi:hypothetical protein
MIPKPCRPEPVGRSCTNDFPLTPTLSRKRERGKMGRAALTLARKREREGPAAKRWEGEGGVTHAHQQASTNPR